MSKDNEQIVYSDNEGNIHVDVDALADGVKNIIRDSKSEVEMETKHTPGPFRVRIIPNSLKRIDILGPPAPDGSDYSPICSLSIHHKDYALWIVNACNNFDDLLAACKEGLAECERSKHQLPKLGGDIVGLLERIERIEAAIKLAEE